jgi:arginine-tRNA-protein transferase
MAYKARFRPSEILAGGSWRELTDVDLEDQHKTGTLLVPESVES